jgi:protein-S-isoprenylcysteine O-methyltransferase Ste14
MMQSDDALAERLTRRRARIAAVMAVFFMLSMIASLGHAPSRPETFRLAAWTVWTVALLVFLVTGGALWRGRGVRALLNDETTQAHRQQAFVAGFWVMIVVAFAIYAASFIEIVDAREAVRVLMTSAIVGALLRFSYLERRSLA